MPKFALEKREFTIPTGSVAIKVVIYDLIINGENQFHKFEDAIATSSNKSYESQLDKIATLVDRLSQGQRLRAGRRKKIEGIFKKKKKGVGTNKIQDEITPYELKTPKLRLYYLYFECENKYIVICLGGYKKNQKKDIRQFKSICKQIIEQISDYGDLTTEKRE